MNNNLFIDKRSIMQVLGCLINYPNIFDRTDKYCLNFVNKIYGVVLNINPLSIKCIKLYYPVEYFDYLLPKLYLTSAFKRLLQKNITKY